MSSVAVYSEGKFSHFLKFSKALKKASRKVSGRGGWKQTRYLFGETRTLNKRELTAYEQYCEYCEQVIGCKPAADWFWYIETSKLPSV